MLKAVLDQYEFTDRNTRDHLAQTIGTCISCTRCASHTGFLAHGNSKGEAKISGHQNNSKSSEKYERKERRYNNGKIPKQCLTSAKDKTIEFPKGRGSLYYKLD